MWAYRQRRGPDLAEWKARVLECCYQMNDRFPSPFRGNEVRKVKDTAYSVAVWTWTHMLDYARYRTPELQAARGRRRRELQREGTAERDKAIIQAVSEGRSMRDVGREHGLTAGAIHWILSRSVQ